MTHADGSTQALPRLRKTPLRARSAALWLARQVAACGWMAAPLAIAAGTRIALFLVGDVSARMLSLTPINGAPFSGALATWQRMDAAWYTGIARDGYSYSPVGQSGVNFFPLYPLTIRLTQRLVAWVPHTNTYVLAGMLVSWIAFAVACVLLYRLACDRFGEATAYGSVLLLATFPFSFYFGAVFSESLYLALALAAFLGIERRNWWLASAAAMLASAERPPGLLVGACVILAYGLDWVRTRHPLRLDLLSLALTPLGIVAFASYCWVRFHDPFAYAKTSWAGWHGGHLQKGALLAAWQAIRHPGGWVHGVDFLVLVSGIYVVLLILFLLTLIPIARLLGAPYALFALVSCMAPVVTYAAVTSMGRYLSVVFPSFIVVAYALRRWPWLREGVVITSAVFLGLFTALFVSGYTLP